MIVDSRDWLFWGCGAKKERSALSTFVLLFSCVTQTLFACFPYISIEYEDVVLRRKAKGAFDEAISSSEFST